MRTKKTDVLLLQRAFRKANHVQVVTHGQEAIDYLSGAGQEPEEYALPAPVLLNLNLRTKTAWTCRVGCASKRD